MVLCSSDASAHLVHGSLPPHRLAERDMGRLSAGDAERLRERAAGLRRFGVRLQQHRAM